MTPLATFAAEPLERDTSPPKTGASQTVATPNSFDLKNAAVQDLVRATAIDAVSGQPLPEVAEPRQEKLADIRFQGPRLPHHMECDALDCTAFTKENEPLYTVSREQMRDQSIYSNGKSNDQWLACQQGNDLLSTFERFDQCRGLSIGLPPVQLRDLEIKVPPLRL
jgi:hypothetical protein